jgi:hypothetical protein
VWLLGTLGAFVTAVFIHAIVVRLVRRGTAVALFVVTGALVGAIWLAIVAARETRALPLIAAVLLFAFLCELYIFTFTLVANSVAVSLLLTVRAGCVSAAALEQMYRPEAMVQRRLDQLERAALLRRSGGSLTLTAAGLRLISTFTWVTAPIRPAAN